MPLIQVVITLIVIGVLLGLVNRFIPNAVEHQIYPEWDRRHWRCVMDCESVRSFHFNLENSYRPINLGLSETGVCQLVGAGQHLCPGLPE